MQQGGGGLQLFMPQSPGAQYPGSDVAGTGAAAAALMQRGIEQAFSSLAQGIEKRARRQRVEGALDSLEDLLEDEEAIETYTVTPAMFGGMGKHFLDKSGGDERMAESALAMWYEKERGLDSSVASARAREEFDDIEYRVFKPSATMRFMRAATDLHQFAGVPVGELRSSMMPKGTFASRSEVEDLMRARQQDSMAPYGRELEAYSVGRGSGRAAGEVERELRPGRLEERKEVLRAEADIETELAPQRAELERQAIIARVKAQSEAETASLPERLKYQEALERGKRAIDEEFAASDLGREVERRRALGEVDAELEQAAAAGRTQMEVDRLKALGLAESEIAELTRDQRIALIADTTLAQARAQNQASRENAPARIEEDVERSRRLGELENQSTRDRFFGNADMRERQRAEELAFRKQLGDQELTQETSSAAMRLRLGRDAARQESQEAGSAFEAAVAFANSGNLRLSNYSAQQARRDYPDIFNALEIVANDPALAGTSRARAAKQWLESSNDGAPFAEGMSRTEMIRQVQLESGASRDVAAVQADAALSSMGIAPTAAEAGKSRAKMAELMLGAGLDAAGTKDYQDGQPTESRRLFDTNAAIEERAYSVMEDPASAARRVEGGLVSFAELVGQGFGGSLDDFVKTDRGLHGEGAASPEQIESAMVRFDIDESGDVDLVPDSTEPVTVRFFERLSDRYENELAELALRRSLGLTSKLAPGQFDELRPLLREMGMSGEKQKAVQEEQKRAPAGASGSLLERALMDDTDFGYSFTR